MSDKWDIYKVDYGKTYGSVSVPKGFKPFAVLNSGDPLTEAVIYFAKKVSWKGDSAMSIVRAWCLRVADNLNKGDGLFRAVWLATHFTYLRGSSDA